MNPEILWRFSTRLAVIPQGEGNSLLRNQHSHGSIRDALAELAFLRAAKKHHLTKVVTFHKTVARAQGLADRLEYSAKQYLPGKKMWVHAIHGKMPTATRTNLLRLLKEQGPNTLSVVTNCRCLSEGVDVPALDAAVFFDPRQSEIDIVQAVGRVMRLSPTKTVGTVLVPVVVPEGVDAEAFLGSSEFKKVAQVLRALRAHDDSFERKVLKISKAVPNGPRTGPTGGCYIDMDIDSLPAAIRDAITTRVVRLGMGLRADLLTEIGIISAAREFYNLHGKLPTVESPEPVPGMPNDTWKTINAAGQHGHRGLTKGRTLSVILEPLRKELGLDKILTEEQIIQVAREFYGLHKKLPTQTSPEPVPGMPNDTWGAINMAGHIGLRGLTKGRTLYVILEPLRKELGLDKRAK